MVIVVVVVVVVTYWVVVGSPKRTAITEQEYSTHSSPLHISPHETQMVSISQSVSSSSSSLWSYRTRRMMDVHAVKSQQDMSGGYR